MGIKIPDNEFSEQMTGDFNPGNPDSSDTMMHVLQNPEKSDFPDAARRQWNNGIDWWKKKTRDGNR